MFPRRRAVHLFAKVRSFAIRPFVYNLTGMVLDKFQSFKTPARERAELSQARGSAGHAA
jgi:hypothetical protein